MGVLEGKVALITGAGRGTGRAMAEEFARAGAKVVVASRTASTVDEVVAKIASEGGEAIGVTSDVGVREDLDRMIASTIDAYSTVDILVNNARTYGNRNGPNPNGNSHPLEDFPEDEWDWMFQTGVKATFLAMQGVFPYMKESGGRIINFGSRSGVLARGGAAAYNSNKEAIRALSRTAAREWGQYGITVNVINPVVASQTYQSAYAGKPEVLAAELEAAPMRRTGTPEECARLALFIAGPDASYITGMTYAFDGGRTILP
jgi:NAD(P)-dependent dehydrogenase (short-subunit alcohol dehydrogenase family)